MGRGLQDAADYGRKCERIGYDCVWTYEAAHNPFMPLAQVAAATENAYRDQYRGRICAQSLRHGAGAWDLSEVSKDGSILVSEARSGLMWSVVSRRSSIIPPPRLTDYIKCVKAIWDSFQNGSRPDYQGEFFRYTVNNPMFNPGPIEHPDIRSMLPASIRACAGSGGSGG